MKTIRIIIYVAFTWLAPSRIAQALTPPPDGGYPGGNTAEGQNALLNLTAGAYNTAVGFASLRVLTAGNLNTATGADTLLVNTASQNTATGAAALLSNTTGSSNTANGALALLSNTDGNFNVAMGAGALQNSPEGNDNTAVGFDALHSGGDQDTAVGSKALQSEEAGGDNTAIGFQALAANRQGMFNTAIGSEALLANNTGDSNTAVGSGALLTFHNNSGFFGGNTAVGSTALSNSVSGSGNIALGNNAGANVVTATDVTCIGAVGEDVSNSCYISRIFGATSSNGTGVFVNSDGKLGTATSSKRFKEDIKPMDKASEALFALKPVAFRYKKEIDPAGRSQFGLVAEEVEKINPELVVRDKEGRPYSVRYDQVNAMLLNEFLKEHRKVESLEKAMAEQQKENEATRAMLKEQATQIQKVSAQLAAASPSRGGLAVSRLATGRIRRGGPAPQVVSNP
jgi:Chaperone of endosialidase